MNASEIIGVFASIVTLAMISVVVVNGGNTAKIISASGDTFAKSIEAATGRAL